MAPPHRAPQLVILLFHATRARATRNSTYLQTGKNQQNCSLRPASAEPRLQASTVTPQPQGRVAEAADSA